MPLRLQEDQDERPRHAFQTWLPSRSWRPRDLRLLLPPLALFVLLLFRGRQPGTPTIRTSELPLINDEQLRSTADWMDKIYTTLADMTFIPYGAIRRGPHRINRTALVCKRDPATLRLMDLLPYVDPYSVQDSDWFHGSHFADYTLDRHLAAACTVCECIRGIAQCTSLPAHIVALVTSSPERQSRKHNEACADEPRVPALMYDTSQHAFWLGGVRDTPFVPQMNTDFTTFGRNMKAPMIDAERARSRYTSMLDAPTLLKRIYNAYRGARWTSWCALAWTNNEGAYPSIAESLLVRNNWLGQFSPDQFRADLIRAQNEPSKWGYAEIVQHQIEALEGSAGPSGSHTRIGAIEAAQIRKVHFMSLLTKTRNFQEEWVLRWRLQNEEWTISHLNYSLVTAKAERQRLCPQTPCFGLHDYPLWEFRAIERKYLDALLMKPAHFATRCVPGFMPAGKDREGWEGTRSCSRQVEREYHWLFLAYSQSMRDALQACHSTKSKLLPQDTLPSRARKKLQELRWDLHRDEDRLDKMRTWAYLSLPKFAIKAMGQVAHDMDKLDKDLDDTRRHLQGMESLMVEIGWEEIQPDGVEVYIDLAHPTEQMQRLWWLTNKPKSVGFL